MKIAVVTDSTAYLSPEEAAANNIHVVPIPVTLDAIPISKVVEA